jgi:L-fucose mutarotase
MLKHQLIHPKINEVLARAGHHSTILIADGNYPHRQSAAECGARVP